jgi:hypothetical protein
MKPKKCKNYQVRISFSNVIGAENEVKAIGIARAYLENVIEIVDLDYDIHRLQDKE